MLERPTWSHSTGNFPENFLDPFGGFGGRYQAHLVFNLGRKHWESKKDDFFYIPKIPTAKVLTLDRSTWSHSTGNIPEDF